MSDAVLGCMTPAVVRACYGLKESSNYGKVPCIRPLPAIKSVSVRHGDGSIRLD